MTETIYLATAGEYSDFRVVAAFTREEDARAYELADDVQEFELHDGPVEVRTWHEIRWWPKIGDREADDTHISNPYEDRELREFDGREGHAGHHWTTSQYDGDTLTVGGWDLKRVRKTYSEQRAQYIATKGAE